MKKFFIFLASLSFMPLFSNAQTQLVGDANNDGSLDVSDIVTIVNNVLSNNGLLSFNTECDANSDGLVDISDIVKVVNRILEGIYAYKTCPDDNHPHIIDLGLPSGTLWSCCNVGATKPEEYGGHYAWGETNVKSSYNWHTYEHAYYTDNQNSGQCDFWESEYVCWYYTYIGENISGTEHDAAFINWGGNWRMPTLEQAEELCSNYKSHVYYGDGNRFIFDNGGILTLPFTGYIEQNVPNYQGKSGMYLTATLNHYQPNYGWEFSSNDSYSKLRCYGQRGRIVGRSVRPVWIP